MKDVASKDTMETLKLCLKVSVGPMKELKTLL